MWTRTGACQPERCGSACCTFTLLEVNPVYLRQPDLASWARLHGIELTEWHQGRVLAKLSLSCSALDGDGRCSLYGQPERPDLCATFPFAPADLLGLESVCTYTFTPGATDGLQRRDPQDPEAA